MITSFFKKQPEKRLAEDDGDAGPAPKRSMDAHREDAEAAAAEAAATGAAAAGAAAAGGDETAAASASASSAAPDAAAGAGPAAPLPYGIRVHPSWERMVRRESGKPYFAELMRFVQAERASKTVFPREDDVFAALLHTALDDVKVVVLGQDPYHGPGQAHGLSFSVRPGVKVPPSLRNMYKELASDMGIPPASHGTLTSWAAQGVLLLNTVLTVVSGKAHAHKKRGWETFTAAVLDEAAKRPSVVFMLWGKPAQSAGQRASSRPGHCRLLSPHPSPLSATRGFFGCRHFSQANTFLQGKGRGAIRWELPADAQATE